MNIKILSFCVALILLIISGSDVKAEVNMDVNNQLNVSTFPSDNPEIRSAMTSILLRKLTIWVRRSDNHPVYSYSCRNARYGCQLRIETMVDYIFNEAKIQKFDPWLVAAMAWHESHFNPFAVSNQNAFGILQMLRRSRWSHGLRFVHNPRYRARCRNQLGACQQEIIERSIYWARRSIASCGSIQGGLRMYNSGRCDGPRRYASIVLRLREEFLQQKDEYINGSNATTTTQSWPMERTDIISCK